MRRTRVFLRVALAIITSSVVLSCTNAEVPEPETTLEVKPAKTPDFCLYSGSTVLATTMVNGTRADVRVNDNYFKIQDFNSKDDWMRNQYPVLYQYFDNAPERTDRGEQVSQAEYNAVMAYLKDHPNEGGTTCNLTTYFIQNVGGSSAKYNLAFKNGESVHHYAEITGSGQMDYMKFDDTHINDYNAHWGVRALCVNIPLVNPSYHDSYASLLQENHYRFYVIEFDGKKNLYLCFDYATNKYDNGQLNFPGDGVYDDWVIKIIPADGSEIGGGSTPDPEDEEDEFSFYDYPNVEVNLALNDKHEEGDWIHTKLSVHVRAVTDVEVFIPMDQAYYCDADDMNIVVSHRLNIEEYIPQSTTEAYTINGTEVKATVTFETGGIRVKVQGMTAGLLQYLQENYGDGLTFEVWNYYNINATNRETLKPLLDKSTVTFTSAPQYYVNGFGVIGDDQRNPWDCVVTPPTNYSVFEEYTADTYYGFDVVYKK